MKIRVSFEDSDLKNINLKDYDFVLCHQSSLIEASNVIKCNEDDVDGKILESISKQISDIYKSLGYSEAFVMTSYNFFLMPFLAYLNKILDLKESGRIENIQLCMPTNYFFKSRLKLFLAEGEVRFNFLYSRQEAFSKSIYTLLKNDFDFYYDKNSLFGYGILESVRSLFMYFGKFFEDIIESTLIDFNDYNLEIKDKVLLLRSSVELSNYLDPKEFTIVHSNSTSSDNSKKNADFERKLPKISFLKVIQHYAEGIIKILFSKKNKYRINFRDKRLNITDVINQALIAVPSLKVYEDRLLKLNIDQSTKLFSFEINSPYSFIENRVAKNCGLQGNCIQVVDLNPRPCPRLFFMEKFHTSSNFFVNQNRNLVRKDQQILISKKPAEVKIHDSYTDLENTKISFFDSDSVDVEQRKKIFKEIRSFAKNNNKELIIHQHPRRKDKIYLNQKYLDGSLGKRLENSEYIVTYPSAIISELIKFNKPIVIIFMGPGGSFNWHYSFEKSYPGTIQCFSELHQESFLNDVFISYPNYKIKVREKLGQI